MPTLVDRFAAYAAANLPPWVTPGARADCERAYMAGAAEVLSIALMIDARSDAVWQTLAKLREGMPGDRGAS